MLALRKASPRGSPTAAGPISRPLFTRRAWDSPGSRTAGGKHPPQTIARQSSETCPPAGCVIWPRSSPRSNPSRLPAPSSPTSPLRLPTSRLSPPRGTLTFGKRGGPRMSLGIPRTTPQLRIVRTTMGSLPRGRRSRMLRDPASLGSIATAGAPCCPWMIWSPTWCACARRSELRILRSSSLPPTTVA